MMEAKESRPNGGTPFPEFHGRRRFSPASAFIVATVTLASFGVLAFLFFGSEIRMKLQAEVFSLSYQFLLIVVIGGAISLVYKEFTVEQEQDRERRNFLRQMHSGLLSTFNAAKRVRRTLRAEVGFSAEIEIMKGRELTAAAYREQMDSLMEAQLTFEVHAKQADDHSLFFAHGEQLAPDFKRIEEYLRQIIEEYERCFVNFTGTPAAMALADLPKLAEFIGPDNVKGDFHRNFKFAFRDVLSALSKASLR